MQRISAAGGVRVHVMQLDPGDYLLESLRDFLVAENIRNGAVVSGIGTLDECTMHMVASSGMPPVEVFPRWDKIGLELVSMQGVVADGVPHIHMTISMPTGAIGGHLEEGCRILYLGEVVVLEFIGLDLVRVPTEANIMRLTARTPSLE